VSAFVAVACQHCKAAKIGELLTGVARFKCPRCKTRSMAGRDDKGRVRYLSIDKPLKVVRELSQIA
jgi:transposase-like protein